MEPSAKKMKYAPVLCFHYWRAKVIAAKNMQETDKWKVLPELTRFYWELR